MNLTSFPGHRRATAAQHLAAALLGGALFSPAISADYSSFKFSPETPYYVEDNKVDFGTYNGFRRYHSECHTCHGPAGMGSAYAPALMKSMEVLTFDQFVEVVINGRTGMDQRVMPGFASNLNVLPYISDLYAYLKARSDGVVGTARPPNFPKVKP
ncbi:c-type cytochrome [Thiocapsa rosea]|uniref:Cbb3-type cytochrome c oxidase subunit III n=1 Tax=Thiocapsa rosea TaxID=69360 RepID=A0A495VER5_9GAMM|nr:c-type cytochrome [Thiocapsa rosea]RKT47093.1 cbb3-type cytochrome c oxidase subunit III [Thiocapsa rosea]